MDINVFYGRFQPIHSGHTYAIQCLDAYNKNEAIKINKLR